MQDTLNIQTKEISGLRINESGRYSWFIDFKRVENLKRMNKQIEYASKNISMGVNNMQLLYAAISWKFSNQNYVLF